MSRAFAGSALLVVAAMAGCGGGGDGSPSNQQTPVAVEGTWVACGSRGGAVDQKESLRFSGSSLTIATDSTFTSANGTCTGQGTGAVSTQGTTFTLGTNVTATLGQASVTAQELNIPSPDYTIVYVDTGVTPARLYLGDASATPGLDGTAPGKRPTVLDAAWPHAKQ